MITALKPHNWDGFKIKVMGIGGAGGNIVSRIYLAGLKCETIILNTDIQALSRVRAHHVIQIGESTTKGGGAGADPELGRKSAEESLPHIIPKIEDADLLILVAGLGNGTGTGASPVIAQYAKERRILTIGVFTLPFRFEGKDYIAYSAISEIEKHLNTMIIIDNNEIPNITSLDSSVKEAYAKVDEVVKNCIESIISIIQDYSEINVDFNDLKALISRGGVGYFAKGVAEKPEDVKTAIRSVLENPLLKGASIQNVKGALVNIKSNGELKMQAFQEIMEEIRSALPPDVPMKYGIHKEGNESVQNYAEIYFIGTTGKNNSDDIIDKLKSKGRRVSNLHIPPGVRKNKG